MNESYHSPHQLRQLASALVISVVETLAVFSVPLFTIALAA